MAQLHRQTATPLNHGLPVLSLLPLVPVEGAAVVDQLIRREDVADIVDVASLDDGVMLAVDVVAGEVGLAYFAVPGG